MGPPRGYQETSREGARRKSEKVKARTTGREGTAKLFYSLISQLSYYVDAETFLETLVLYSCVQIDQEKKRIKKMLESMDDNSESEVGHGAKTSKPGGSEANERITLPVHEVKRRLRLLKVPVTCVLYQ